MQNMQDNITQQQTNKKESCQQSAEQIYSAFMQWFVKNGGLHNSILFPSYFQPTLYTGVSSTSSIPPNKIILAIPKSIIISVSMIKDSCPILNQIIRQNFLLNNPNDDDTDYNIITLFLIIQTMKGPKSTWYQYLKVLQLAKPQTIVNWTDQQIHSICDTYLTHHHFIHGLRKGFQPIYQFFRTLSLNPLYKQLFPYSINKSLFNHCYASVMTRGFGWGLPQTMLVPYADFFNHAATGVNHYVFDKNLQKLANNKYQYSNNKQLSNDKQEMDNNNEGIDKSVGQQQQSQQGFQSLKPQLQYIKKHKQLNISIFPFLRNPSPIATSFQPNLRQSYLISHPNQITCLSLKYNPQTRLDPTITNSVYNFVCQKIIDQGFQQVVYLSTDQEDNDSEDEQGLETNHEDSLQHVRQESVRNKIIRHHKTKQYLNYVYNRVQATRPQKFTQPKPSVNREFQDNVKFDWWHVNTKHQSTKNNNQVEKRHIKQAKGEQNQQNWQKGLQQTSQNNKQIKCSNKYESSYQQSIQGKYFIVSSSHLIHPHQQIFNCYGRRSNRFLLTWYGFCFTPNKYDSVPFRIWPQQISSKTGHLLYTRFISDIQWAQGIPLGNQRYSIRELSDQFRFKLSSLDYRLLAYLRFKYLESNKLVYSIYQQHQAHMDRIIDLQMEIQIFLIYQRYLNQLYHLFFVRKDKIISSKSSKSVQNNQNNHKSQDKSQTKQLKKQQNKEPYKKSKDQQNTHQSRMYYKQILQKSNQDIIKKHMIAVKQMIRVLLRIQIQRKNQKNKKFNQLKQNQLQQNQLKQNQLTLLPRQLLTQIYRNLFSQLQIKQSNKLKLMVRQYFLMLSISKLTKVTTN